MEHQITTLKKGIDGIFNQLGLTPTEMHFKYKEILNKIDFSDMKEIVEASGINCDVS